MGVYMIYRVVFWLGDVGARCLAMRGPEGCTFNLWQALCPPATLTRKGRTDKWMREKGYDRDPLKGKYFLPCSRNNESEDEEGYRRTEATTSFVNNDPYRNARNQVNDARRSLDSQIRGRYATVTPRRTNVSPTCPEMTDDCTE